MALARNRPAAHGRCRTLNPGGAFGLAGWRRGYFGRVFRDLVLDTTPCGGETPQGMLEGMMIKIDGSQGEGGGQVLRTSLALSLVTGQPFVIERIRAGRKKPGLLRQHLTAVQAAVAVGRADVDGAEMGSQRLTFRPKRVQGGEYHFAVGTAGSAVLVLQAVLPALMTAPAASRVLLEGGTHNPFAPPFPFLERVFLPILERMGPKVTLTLERPGFYPAGGGRFVAEIEPSATLSQLVLTERGEMTSQRAVALVANVSREVARRELSTLQRKLSLPDDALIVEEESRSRGPGNVLMVEVTSAHVTELFTGFGERGVQAERVANGLVKPVREYLATDVPVGRHLADQLLVPMAMAGGGTFATLPLTRHTETNMDVIRAFLDVEFEVEREGRDWVRITVGERK